MGKATWNSDYEVESKRTIDNFLNSVRSKK